MKIKNIKAFTLIEVMVGIAILGIIMIPISNYFVDVFDLWFASTNQISAQREARNAMEEMTKFVRQAENPATDLVPAVGATSYSEISFTYVGSQGNKDIKYYKSNDDLFRVVDGATSTIIYDKLQSIYFCHVSSYVVHIGNMVVQQSGGDITLDRWVHLRNR